MRFSGNLRAGLVTGRRGGEAVLSVRILARIQAAADDVAEPLRMPLTPSLFHYLRLLIQ
ncbi:hypothetical protein [Achromobacter sp.]|uniref:hypothetical protein n=1 Tax=Achromobacter sp. TaxID=134375 RepID=UPI002897E918|nr:hypothetical protein [Achromobacter sp.]